MKLFTSFYTNKVSLLAARSKKLGSKCFSFSYTCIKTIFHFHKLLECPVEKSLNYAFPEILSTYHLAKNSGNFIVKSNGEVIFGIRSKFVDFLQSASFDEISGTEHLEIKWSATSHPDGQ